MVDVVQTMWLIILRLMLARLKKHRNWNGQTHTAKGSNMDKADELEIIIKKYLQWCRRAERYASEKAINNAYDNFIDACKKYKFDVRKMTKLMSLYVSKL